MRYLIFAVVLGMAVSALAPATAVAYEEVEVTDGGAIEGTVVWEGEVPSLELRVNTDQQVCEHVEGTVQSPRLSVGESGGVADAVVFLRGIEQGKPLEALDAEAVLDQEGCLYKPFVQVMPEKETLTLINSDPVNHNVHAKQEGHRDPFNYAMPNSEWPEKQTIEKRLYRPGVVAVNCDVHMWMSAYIHVVEHPYYAVTDETGEFRLEDVPPGEYELVMWHPGWEAELSRNAQGQLAGYEYGPPVEKTATVTVKPGGAVNMNFVLNEETGEAEKAEVDQSGTEEISGS